MKHDGVHARPLTLGTLLLVTLALSGVDASLTLAGIRRGILHEVNPMLAPLVSNPMAFIIVKMGLVSLGSNIIWFLQSSRWALPAAKLVVSVYTLLVIYHIYGLLVIA